MILFQILDRLRNLDSTLLLTRRRYGSGTGSWLPAKMPFHPEVNRQDHGDDGGGAEHQNRKQNLHHHRDSGYQNAKERYPFSTARNVTITGMKNVPIPRIAV